MRHLVTFTFLVAAVAVVSVPPAVAQQQQQPSSAPGAPPPPPPQPPPMQPAKNCSGQAQTGSGGHWTSSSTCPPPVAPERDAPPPLPPADQEQKPSQKHSTADDNPFPEDVSSKAEAEAKARDAKDAGSGAADAPAAADESSSREKLDKAGDLLGDNSRISNGAGGFIHDPKMAVSDIHVGEFYMEREDYQGAYARFKEASEVDPENALAVFDLAEVARKMNLSDEALQNYQLYLDAMPNGPKAKDARKALKEMASSAKN